ncbi:2-polyprenyl-6-methoxyphenol hydroxylase [Paenibacillaceae bacterium GAS479]|nr:2-polyprenyl-6-methoxyphenol hydroxylase [Paenibacillaceae bacterium GAS479]
MRKNRASVLISGASIAGLTTAYLLGEYGFDVTIVERAGNIRGGGYPIDVRETAVDVMDRMGGLTQLRANHIGTKKISFLDQKGDVIGVLGMEESAGVQNGREIELPRGTLTQILFGLIEQKRLPIRFQFNDSINDLNDNGDGVNVKFKSGSENKYDIVIGADGLHSNTRRLTFGQEQQFSKYLGYCFAGFSVPNDFGLFREGVIYATPGRIAAVYHSENKDVLHAFLVFVTEEPAFVQKQGIDEQRRLTAQAFDGAGWETSLLVQAMMEADDLYCDVVSQIHMPRWSKGRVALVGDSAFAPSFLTGQGTSLALVGAYILAGELALHEEPDQAFAAYEKIMRPFAEENQDQIYNAPNLVWPRTQEEIEARNQALAALQLSERKSVGGNSEVYTLDNLTDYSAVLQKK